MTTRAILIGLLLLTGCNNHQRDSDLESRLDSLEMENKILKGKLDNQPLTPYPERTERINSFKPITVFAFTRLVVEQEEFDLNNTHDYKKTFAFNVCSSIEEYSNMDNDVKYKLMDHAQQNYLSTNQHKNGHVKSRECFVFTTYEEASKKREDFLVDK